MGFGIMRRLPFARSATPLQAATYLLGISLFSISFLVFLNSSISFVITDRIGVKTGVGDIVGTLGFVDELVALVACPVWGLVSDRLGVRLVAVLGYVLIALSLVAFVAARNIYPQLLLARVLFAIGATAAATMVTAILPSLTDESESERPLDGDDVDPSSAFRNGVVPKFANTRRNPRDSALSIESQLTITPERFAESQLRARVASLNMTASGTTAGGLSEEDTVVGGNNSNTGKPAKLAGFVGLFTGCGALVALTLFLPLPAQFGRKDGVTMAEAVAKSFYVVAVVALFVAVFVFVGLQNLRGEEGKGWRMLLGQGVRKPPVVAATSVPIDSLSPDRDELANIDEVSLGDDQIASGQGSSAAHHQALPYWRLLQDSVKLGFTDADVALGYLGGFVARASSVAISLFIPLFINAFFMDNGFCQGSPNDPSPDLKKECRAAYVLSSIVTGVAQLMGLICAPLFGYLSSRYRNSAGANIPIVVATSFGIVGYIVFPLLSSPEPKNVDGRGGSPVVFLVATLLGISQIGAIVCSLGSLGRGVLSADIPSSAEVPSATLAAPTYAEPNGDVDAPEGAPLLSGGGDHGDEEAALAVGSSAAFSASRIRLKGSIAGVYSWCGGAAILLLTKLGGLLFDKWSTGAPFYMMALFNAMLLLASLSIDAGRTFQKLKK